MVVLDQILGSKIRAEVLRLLFAGPHNELHVREIERRTGFNDRAIRQELAKLKRLDLLRCRRDGNRLYYSAQTDHPLYVDLRNLALKTVGAVADMGKALDVPGVNVAFVFGSFARGDAKAHSDVDLLVVGSLALRAVSRLLTGMNEATGRAVNPYVLTPEEFRRRLEVHDRFLTRVLSEPRIMLKGTDHDVVRLGTQRVAEAASDQPTGDR